MDFETILLKLGHVDQEALQKARSVKQASGGSVEEILLAMGLINRSQLLQATTLQRTLEAEERTSRLDFLTSVSPFDTLSREELSTIAQAMDWVSYGPGEIIIRQGSTGTHFYIVKTGLVRVFLDERGSETVLGFLGEGECFGEMSLLNREPTNANIQATEPVLALRQTEGNFLAMIHSHPLFYKFFNQLLTKRMKRVYRELLSQNPGIGQVEPYLYRKQVSELVGGRQQLCHDDEPIRAVAQKILDNESRPVVVVDERERPKGIVTTSQMLRSVLIDSRAPDEPVATIMDTAFQTIDTGSFFFDALHEMVKHRTDRLVAMERNKTVGLVTGLDLLRFRGREVLSLLRNLEAASNTAELNLLRAEIEKVLKALVSDGALASQACRIVSELNDRMVRRVIELAEVNQGGAPAGFAWLGLGSEGRREQTLLTDQDNAIIYRDTGPGETEAYFSGLSKAIVNNLSACGMPLCKGNIMATNRDYFGPVDEWKRRTAYWVTTAVRERTNMADLYVFLDFRTIYGDANLERELRAHVAAVVQEHPYFLTTLAQGVVDIPEPLGFFKDFIVEKSGKYKNRLNLKNFGLVPLVACVKLLAWSQAIADANTLERIRSLTEAGILTKDDAEYLDQAFETFLTLRIRNNLQDLEHGREPSNYVDPATLSARQKQLLKEAFHAVRQLQKTTREVLRVDAAA